MDNHTSNRRKRFTMTANQAANEAKVKLDVINNLIRRKVLNVAVINNEFLINPAQLRMLNREEMQVNFDFDLISVAIGLDNAIKGAILFDNAFTELEIQYNRILEDNIKLEKAEDIHRHELERWRTENNRWYEQLKKGLTDFSQMPKRSLVNSEWVSIQKILFADVHFYFIAGALIDSSVKRLENDLNSDQIKALREKYSLPLKQLNEARNNLEHLYERIDKVSDLGNMTNGKYHFNGFTYDLHFESILELRNELCDLFIRKSGGV